jgi:hypothetical protein
MTTVAATYTAHTRIRGRAREIHGLPGALRTVVGIGGFYRNCCSRKNDVWATASSRTAREWANALDRRPAGEYTPRRLPATEQVIRLMRARSNVAVTLSMAVMLWSRAAGSALPQDAASPDRDAVLQRVGDYLDRYEQDLTAIVAQEDYRQRYLPSSLPGAASLGAVRVSSRHLRSDVLVLADPVRGWVTFRDVFEVDGKPVRDRDERLATLFSTPTDDAVARAEAITAESARYNVDVNGISSSRTLNVPTAALLYLRRAFQPRSTFTLAGVQRSEGQRVAELAFVEQALPRIIRSPGELPMGGRAWVDAESGRVQRTSLDYTLHNRQLATEATIEVTYADVPRLALWLPAGMREKYESRLDGRFVGAITAEATYSNFRRFSVAVTEKHGDLTSTPDAPATH